MLKVRFIIVFFLFEISLAHSQIKSDTFYFLIPETLIQGKITTFPNNNMLFKDATNYAFIFYSSSPHAHKNSSYFISLNNKIDRVINNLCDIKTLEPYQLMDSLTKYGRPFFRRNAIYGIKLNDKQLNVYQVFGEYLYSSGECVVD